MDTLPLQIPTLGGGGPDLTSSSHCSGISPILYSATGQQQQQRSRISNIFASEEGGGGDTTLMMTNNQSYLSSTVLGKQHQANNNNRSRSSYTSSLVPNDVEQLWFDELNLSSCSLNRNLRLLQLFLLAQIEEMSEFDPRDDKKQTGFDDSSAHYRFATGCFSVQNTTEASCHALHLLCQCYDYKETETVFRDVWPIVDKKMDSAFRRTVSTWIREIITSHPQFFIEIKLEALCYLLVNPWGDRFIQLIESFVELLLSRVIRNNPLPPEECAKIYSKPNYYGNNFSSITARQILVFMKQTRMFVKYATKTRKKMLKDEIHGRKIEERIRCHILSIDLEIENKSREIEEIQHEFPELGSNSEYMSLNGESSAAQPSYCFERFQKLLSWKPETPAYSTLQGVDKILTSQLKTVATVAQSLETLFNKYNSVWYIIGLKTPKPRCLDIASLFTTTSFIPQKTVTFVDFINTIKQITLKFLDDERLKRPVSTELLVKFKTLDFKFDHLKICWKKLESQRVAISSKYVDCDLHLLQEAEQSNFHGVDWRTLSKLNVAPLNRSLLSTLTPNRKIGSQTTGFTPGLQNFLNPHNMKQKITGLKNSTSTAEPEVSTLYSEKITRHPTSSLSPIDSTETSNFIKLKNKPENVCKSTMSDKKVGSVQNIAITITPANSQKPPLPPTNIKRFSVGPLSTTSIAPPEKSSANVQPNASLIMLDETNGTSDVSISEPSSPRPPSGEMDASTQARIARIMSALSTPASSKNCSFASLRVSDSFDGKLPGSNSRRSSLAFKSRISTSSNNGGQQEEDVVTHHNHNKSLLENWTDEKGIMDMSINSNGLWGSNESSADES